MQKPFNEMRGDKEMGYSDEKIAASNHLVKEVFIISLLLEKINAFSTTNTSIPNKELCKWYRTPKLFHFARNELLAYAPDRQLPSLPNLNNVQVYSLSHKGLAPEKVRKKCNGGLATGKGTTEK